MAEISLTLIAFVFAYVGFAWLALGQERHLARVFGEIDLVASTHWTSRAMGWIAILLAIPLALIASCVNPVASIGMGFLLGGMLVCGAAMAVALTLTWRPLVLRFLAWPAHSAPTRRVDINPFPSAAASSSVDA